MSDKTPWLNRPETIRKLRWILYATLAVTVLLELVIRPHGHFKLDSLFAFSAWYGFLSCLVMVVLARILGLVLKRRDDYYDD